MMKKLALWLGLVALVLQSGSASAQKYAQDTRSYFDFGEQFYSSVVQSANGKSLDVRLTSASALLSFVRSNSQQAKTKGEYYAVRDVTVEINKRGVSQAILTQSVKDTIYAKTFEETTAKNRWYPMLLQLTLPKMDSTERYTMRIEVRDGILNKLAVRPVLTDLRVREFDPSAYNNLAIGVGDILLFDTVTSTTGTTKAQGDTYPFSTDIKGAVSVILPKSTDPQSIRTKIVLTQVSSVPEARDSMREERATVIPISQEYIAGKEYQVSLRDGHFNYDLKPVESSNTTTVTIPFTIAGKRLDQGRYQILVVAEAAGQTRSYTEDLTLNWPQMPLTLEDPRDAIAPLVHLTTEDQFKELQKGQRQDLIRKLYQFWKKYDPTPETAFNEKMAVFYQRADYADFNFANGKTLDGALTDRGKVYLLYGAPTNIGRTLLPGEDPIEIWTYSNNVKKVFKFTDESGRGEYKLAEVSSM